MVFLETRTRGGTMEGADKSTELWRHPIDAVSGAFDDFALWCRLVLWHGLRFSGENNTSRNGSNSAAKFGHNL